MSTHNLVKSLRADRSQLASEVRQLRAEVERAKRALLAHGFTDCGGAEWKPPLGPHPGTLLAEVERLRAEANARAVEELEALNGMSELSLRAAIQVRIAELSKPAAKESEPARCAERVWASGDMEACGKPLPCSDHTKPEEEPDWTVTLAAQAKAVYDEDTPDESVSAALLLEVVRGLCNLGREVRRGGKS